MMAATSEERIVMEPSRTNCGQTQVVDRLKMLYPMVNEEETPLPRSWSPKDKYNYIGLSQNNLRVHYKGTWALLWPRSKMQLKPKENPRFFFDSIISILIEYQLVRMIRSTRSSWSGWSRTEAKYWLKMAELFFRVCQRPKQRNQLIARGLSASMRTLTCLVLVHSLRRGPSSCRLLSLSPCVAKVLSIGGLA